MKVTVRSFLRLIEANGGPFGLDLSNADLSGLDLSPGYVSRQIPSQIRHTDLPSWAAMDKQGRVCMDLRGAILRNAKAVRANLSHAQLQGCDFRGAELKGSRLSEGDARGAVFSGADLTEADLHLADLRGARFGGATLRNAKLTGADLRDSYLLDADLIGARVADAKFGPLLLNERRGEYLAFLQSWKYDNAAYKLARRYMEARNIYRNLKATLTNQGYAEMAGGMHFRERRASKWSHHPLYARASYPEELPPESARTIRRRVMIAYFYVRHMLSFLGAQAAEVTFGYGERPLRPALWGIATILMFGAIYWASGTITTDRGGAPSLCDAFIYSLGAFSTIGTFDYSPAGPVGKLLTGLEAVLGVGTFSLFLFTLGVKMARS